MADFVLGRLKFTFLGPWVTGTSYIKDDIVNYGGQSYACTGNHTANANFYTDLGTGNWSLIAGGLYFKGAWYISTYYKLNDIVQYGGNSYVCTTPHTSTTGTIYDSFSNWTLYTSGLFFRGAWTANTQYNLNDIVRYGADAYVVTTQHVSPATANGFQITASADYQLLTGGLEFQNNYNNSTNYAVGDVVRYGGYVWVATQNTVGNLPTDPSNWQVLSTGYNARGVYNNATQYLPGDVVNYGAYSYVAKITTTGNLPSSSGQWSLINKGTEYLGAYNPATTYVAGDVVGFGGNTYIAITETTGTNPTVANSASWTTFTTGLNWKGTWDSGTTYQASDVVNYANSSFISVSTNNLNNVPNASATWQTLVRGSPDNVMLQPGDITIRNSLNATVRLPVGANGQILVVSSNGLPQWETAESTANVYYICADTGVDSPTAGISLQRPWKTIQYATQRLNAANTPGQTLATIMLKAGTYNETLPITLPPGCSIFGDTTRTTIVQPAPGLSLDGATDNANSTMFLMSDSTGMGRMTLKGMTGYQANTAVTANTTYQSGSDISTHTIRGVFLRLNPASPITRKSPYINDMTAISSGGVGVMIDGSVHGSGNKSMLFHSFTIIGDGGVGYYVTNGGRAEIVSCFTYFCYFGYVANNGGIIRALNGNNSYGNFGAVATGYLPSEIPISANVYGSMINYVANTVFPSGSIFTSNNYMLGATSNARATVLTFQTSNQQVYFKYTGQNANTFINNERLIEYTDSTFTTPTGFYANSQTTNAITGQNGVVLTVNNISSNTTILPGCSLQFATGSANTGYDPYAYVIASVSTWTNQPNNAILTLASTKPSSNPAFDGQNIIIRQNFSNIRLTGHDFLGIGTGGIANTNYPNTLVTQYIPSNQTIQNYPGRVYYVTTDQSGNFQVGPYFAVNQATGSATLNASAFNLSGLSSLRLGSIGAQIGAQINEFSTDGTMTQNSNVKVPTQSAVKTYVDTQLAAANTITSNAIATLSTQIVTTSAIANVAQYTISYNSANTTYDSSGRVIAFTQGGYSVSNIVYAIYDTTGGYYSTFGTGTITNSIISYKETVNGVTRNVAVAYTSSSGTGAGNTVNTITIS